MTDAHGLPAELEPSLKKAVVEELEQGEALYNQFAERMNRLRDRGLKDCKMKLVVGPETTTASVITTMNNILRLIDAKKARPLTIKP